MTAQYVKLFRALKIKYRWYINCFDLKNLHRLEIFAPDAMVATIVSVLMEHTHIGNTCNGKLFILPVEEGLRFDTGERGADVA